MRVIEGTVTLEYTKVEHLPRGGCASIGNQLEGGYLRFTSKASIFRPDKRSRLIYLINLSNINQTLSIEGKENKCSGKVSQPREASKLKVPTQ